MCERFGLLKFDLNITPADMMLGQMLRGKMLH